MENSMLIDLIRSVVAEICAYIIIELLKKHQIKLSDLEKYDNTDIEEVNENLDRLNKIHESIQDICSNIGISREEIAEKYRQYELTGNWQ